MKKIQFLMIGTLLLFIAGCQKDSLAPAIEMNENGAIVLDGSSEVGLRGKEMVTKPMKLWLEAVTDPAQGVLECTPAGNAPKGGWMQGHATHLGNLNFMESPWEHGSCKLDFSQEDVLLVIEGSHGEWTGANGDKLIWEGTYKANSIGFTADLNIVGGTGKFLGAIGNVTGSGYTDPKTGYAVGLAEGWITIPK